MADVGFSNLAAMKAAFANLDKRSENKILRKALRDEAKVYRSAAVAAAPVKSGTTRANIKVRAGKRNRKKNFISVVCGVGKKWWSSDSWYAAAVEFGHRIGPRKLGNTRKFWKGLHWLKNAYDRSESRCKEVFLESCAKYFNEVVKEVKVSK